MDHGDHNGAERHAKELPKAIHAAVSDGPGGCLLGWQATKTVGSVCTIAFDGLKSKKRAGSTRPSSVDREA